MSGVVLAAAALHDVREDCAVSSESLVTTFGNQVATIVDELTQDKDQADEEYISQLRGSSVEAKLVKLADRWDNVSELLLLRPSTFGGYSFRDYLANSQSIHDACAPAHQGLGDALQTAISRGLALASEVESESSILSSTTPATRDGSPSG